MADRRLSKDIESLLRFDQRSVLGPAEPKQPVLGGFSQTFGSDPAFAEPSAELLTGLVCLPIADEAPAGWGFPYDSGGLIDPPRGTLGGTHPQGIFKRDGATNVTFTRSDTWFPNSGSRPMSDQTGGSDWQSGDGTEVITYGILGRGRYISVPGNRIFKGGSEVILSPSPVRVGAVSSMVQQGDNVILVATSVLRTGSDDIVITAYTMTDSTVTVQDGGVAAQTLITYSMSALESPEDGAFRSLDAMNFSADGAKLVVVTGQGDLVEFAVAPGTLNVTITEELTRTNTAGTNFDINDYTESVTPPDPQYSWSCSVELDGGVFNATITNWMFTSNSSANASMSKSGTLSRILISDFDLLTGDRIDLKIEVNNPTRTYTQNGNQVAQYFFLGDPLNPDPSLFVFDVDETFCGDTNPTTPGDAGATPPFGSIDSVNNNYCRIDEPLYELKLGGTVIDTFQGFGEITSSLSQTQTNVRDEELGRIIIADLRTGFLAYDKVRTELDELVIDGGSTTRTQTRENMYTVAGGQNLTDFQDIISENIIESQDMDCSLWFFKHDEFPSGGTEPDIDFPIFTLDTIPSAIIETTFDSHGIAAPDLELAVVDFEDPITSALESRYTAFSKGIAAELAEIDEADLGGGVVATTEPRCLPKGLI